MSEKILELRNIKKFYTGGGNVVVGLDGVSMSLSRGEFVAVTGESGSGKSTLAHVICGILPYESGEMYFNGERTSHFGTVDWDIYRRDNIGFISQNYGILPGASVMKNVESALLLSGMRKRDARAEAESILRKVELWSMRRRRAAKLSSGQKQRLSIARALAKPAPILVADEPTGNLDAENSRKIIELLAKVAEERLVILITHEFAEAEHYATRHIVIKDGRITADIPLRRASAVKETVRSESRKRPHGLGLYTARLQTFGRPVWSAATVLLFTLSAFAIFVFLGVFISNIDDASTYLYNNAAFPNGDPKRLIVATYEGTDLTDEDIDRILSIKNVESVERGDVAADVQYAYRRNVDFTVKYQTTQSGIGTISKPVIFIEDDAPFIRTMPTGKDAEGVISEGRAPVGFFEVAAERGKAELGDFITVYICDRKHWAKYDALKMTFEVVGITDKMSDLCFSSDVALCFEFLRDNASKREFVMWSDEVDEGKFLTPESFQSVMMDRLSSWKDYYATEEFSAADPEAYGSEFVTLDWAGDWGREWSNNGCHIWINSPNIETPLPPHSIISTSKSGAHNIGDVLSNLFFVSEKDFRDIVGDKVKCPQISVFLDDYAFADAVLDQLHRMGYLAASPYRIGTSVQDEELAAEREQTLNVCFTALVIIIVLETMLLTAMFSVQKESYRTLCDIGLTGSVAARAVFIQIISFSLIGQAATLLGLKLLERAGVERIVSLMLYLSPKNALVMFSVNLAVSLISGTIIVRILKRSTNPAEHARPDIDFEIENTDDAEKEGGKSGGILPST